MSAVDTGSGVDPSSIEATIDGREVEAVFSRGRIVVGLVGIGRGTHRLTVVARDYQELKNMENVPQILPNTRTLRAVFRLAP